MFSKCIIGILPYYYIAYNYNSLIALIIAINGTALYISKNKKYNDVVRKFDILCNIFFILFTIYSKKRTILFSIIAFTIWYINKYEIEYSDFNHILGVQYILLLGHLDYLDLL